MSTSTTNYGFLKPDPSENVNVDSQLNDNFDDIDTELKRVDDNAGKVWWGSRTTSSSVSTGADVGVLRVSNVTLKTGKIYEIFTNPLGLDSDVATDEIRARIRFVTDGTNATASSPILQGAYTGTRQADANVPENKTISTVYVATGNVTASFILCVGRIAGTGNCRLAVPTADDAINIIIKELGVSPTDTGVDI